MKKNWKKPRIYVLSVGKTRSGQEGPGNDFSSVNFSAS